MSIKRVIISAIVSLGAAGSILAGTAPAVVAQAPAAAHVLAAAPNTHFYD